MECRPVLSLDRGDCGCIIRECLLDGPHCLGRSATLWFGTLQNVVVIPGQTDMSDG